MIKDCKQWAAKVRARDPNALRLLQEETRPSVLAEAVQLWTELNTSWAISEQVRYFQLGLIPRGHRIVVRRLISSAAVAKRDSVMAAAMVFVDYTRDTNAFTVRTTAYMQRFVWRYMRSVAKERPDAYCQTLACALRAYPGGASVWDTKLLRRWCLMKACFGRHPAIRFSSLGAYLQPNATIAELSSCRGAMAYSQLWGGEAGMAELHRLVAEARSPVLVHWAEQQLGVAASQPTA